MPKEYVCIGLVQYFNETAWIKRSVVKDFIQRQVLAEPDDVTYN